jgi:two-component system, OmpR family, response regulator ChvI
MTDLGQPSIPAPPASFSFGPRATSSPAWRIILIDDDEEFCESASTNLGDEGFAVTAFSNGPAALQYIDEGGKADVILLDWRMPGMNGLEVLKELRRRGTATPVIFLTALSNDLYEEAALTGGAIDFVDKSRRPAVLVKRVQLIAEGFRPAPDATQGPAVDVIHMGPLELRFDINRLYWRNQMIDLTLTEFRIVAQLAMRSGEDVSYRELYDVVHGKDFCAGDGHDGYRTNVRTLIKRIRQKFREVDAGFDHIHNYARFGYRWLSS